MTDLTDFQKRMVDTLSGTVLKSRQLGMTRTTMTIMEGLMSDLNAINWICGCQIADHPRFECPKMTPDQQKMQRHRYTGYEDLYVADPLMKLLLENVGRAEKVNEVQIPECSATSNVSGSIVAPTKQQQALDAYWSAKTPNEERAAWQAMKGLGMMMEDAVAPVVRQESHDSRYTRAHAILREQLPWADPARLSMALDLVFDVVAGGSLATAMEMTDALMLARSERDAAQMVVASLTNRVAELENYSAGTALLHDEITRLRAVVAAQAKSQTASDLKTPASPKPFPAGALKPPTSDPRRIGG